MKQNSKINTTVAKWIVSLFAPAGVLTSYILRHFLVTSWICLKTGSNFWCWHTLSKDGVRHPKVAHLYPKIGVKAPLLRVNLLVLTTTESKSRCKARILSVMGQMDLANSRVTHSIWTWHHFFFWNLRQYPTICLYLKDYLTYRKDELVPGNLICNHNYIFS